MKRAQDTKDRTWVAQAIQIHREVGNRLFVGIARRNLGALAGSGPPPRRLRLVRGPYDDPGRPVRGRVEQQAAAVRSGGRVERERSLPAAMPLGAHDAAARGRVDEEPQAGEAVARDEARGDELPGWRS